MKGRHGGWSIWLSVAFGMVWLLLLPGQSVARVPGSRDKQQNAETLRVVHGKVTDENGAPIVGANVWIKGTMVGVATDVNGDYTLRINPEAKTLSASFIGYSEAEKTIMPGIGVYNFTLKPEARKLDEVTYSEMLELASLGAQVLNNRSVELAKKYSVELEVRSSLTDVPGTIVREVAQVEGMLIKGVTKNENVAVISLLEVPDVPGMSFNVFSLMAQKKINVGIILQASGRGNNKDLIFTVPLEDVHTATAILQENLQRFGATRVLVDTDVAKVSIVGAGVQSHPGVAAKMFERLYECNINIRMIATSEIKISVIIAKQDADRAVAAVHDAFFQ